MIGKKWSFEKDFLIHGILLVYSGISALSELMQALVHSWGICAAVPKIIGGLLNFCASCIKHSIQSIEI